MQNLGGQTECIMGNWKIENRKKTRRRRADQPIMIEIRKLMYGASRNLTQHL